MFKLLKDLTRAPEPLTPPTSLTPTLAARSRANSRATVGSPSRAPSRGSSVPPSRRGSDPVEPPEPPKVEPIEETDENAKRVVELLTDLEKGGSYMHLVETLSLILAIPATTVTRGAFRRQRGFEIIRIVFSNGLSWRSPNPTNDDAEREVEEVQRWEGVRLAFEVLAWALTEREGLKEFARQDGYLSLLPALHGLTATESSSVINEPSTSQIPTVTQRPDSKVLAYLLAHIFGNNYGFLSSFPDSVANKTPLPNLDGLNVRFPQALHLLWAYTWGQIEPNTVKGKARATTRTRLAISFGHFEGSNDDILVSLVQRCFEAIQQGASASLANLYAIERYLPKLSEFLMTRVYGVAEKRKYETTFPARADWAAVDGEDSSDTLDWRPPSPGLRGVYSSILRRSLEAGVSQEVTWRLFTLIRTERHIRREEITSRGRSGPRTPTRETPPPIDGNATPKKRPHPTLTIPPVDMSSEHLRPDVLDLLAHTMQAKGPDAFVFRGGAEEGGLVLRDLGRAWVSSQKGFTFSCWLNITRLDKPLVLLHVSQQGHTLLQLRLLESSQIGLTTKSRQTESAGDQETTETICPAPDALVPHGQWVHFAFCFRKSRNGDHGDARLFVDGIRVGAMRMDFPVANLPSAAPNSKTSPADAVSIAIGRPAGAEASDPPKQGEGNEWMLGRTLLVEDTFSEDLVLLLSHLGPRYYGNLQEPMGKFLTYEAATAINIHISAQAQSANDKRLFTAAGNTFLAKAIRTGPAILEENILLSLSPKDMLGSESCVNAAMPHPLRARQVRHGTVSLLGSVFPHASTHLDDAVSMVGGGTVMLKLIDMAETSSELATTLKMLGDMIQHSWSASEEMERIHGFELLAALLRPKMVNLVDASCTKIVLRMLGIDMDHPETASVHNSVAYRALGLEFELWSHASLGIISLYLQHFEYLLVTSKHARFNLLRTFQKSAMVKKLLYTLRSGFFDPTVIPAVVDTLRLALVARWSGEDAIKPVFSYLVTSLCQSNAGFLSPTTEPPPAQQAAAMILKMVSELLHNPARLVKLNKTVAFHRLLVIFIASNSAYYVILPCLDMLERCMTTTGVDGFLRSFESEGGFALLSQVLPSIWRHDIQAYILRMFLGKDEGKHNLACPQLLTCLLTSLDVLLQSGGDEEGFRPTAGRTRSGTITSIRSVVMSPLISTEPNGNVEAGTTLVEMLTGLTKAYRTSHSFRRVMTGRRIEGMLPGLAEFAAVSAARGSPSVGPQRKAAADWLAALIELSKLQKSLITQMKLIAEQLRSPVQTSGPGSLVRSPTVGSVQSTFGSSFRSPMSTPMRPASSYVGGSTLSSRTSISSMPGSPTLGSARRRPSTDAGIPVMRPMSIAEKRTPLKRVLTGESVLEGGKDKNAAWKTIIVQTDAQSHSKMTLERKEYWARVSEQDWPRQAASLRTENGVWPDEDGPVTWRLDGSEGPLRMRNRLERINAVPEQGMAKTRHKLRDAIPSIDELSSAVSRVSMAPWEDPFALALGQAAVITEEDATGLSAPGHATPGPREPSPKPHDDLDDSYVEVEENKDDKMRRIAKTLQAGDVVEEAHNIVRIVGVDACPGLLILGKRNLYLIDGLLQAGDGEVIDAKDAPKDVLTIPSGTLVELSSTDQQSLRWSYSEIVENNKRAFLFRDVALELYFADKRNFLIVFRDKRQRQAVTQKIMSKNDASNAISRSVIGNFVLDQVARAMDKPELQLDAMTKRWQHREISNFAYLQLLNQYANRTPNDVTQYPVFPWVLADYSSAVLDLTSESTFRDLSLPMGALTPARREAAVERYSATEGVGEKPFHYGTHYSSSMIVCGFMIRLSPFTEIFLALQGGQFDLADRLFSSIPRAWDSASSDNRGDVRELIPEFFYSTAFLVNLNRHDFGKKQVGDSVDDVILPPWALNDPLLFTHRHREALESDYVSRHLSRWIDLTFGYKQRDPASYNCFHPLSYRGAVDLENIQDESEKAASTAIIHNFGQTPEQIFKAPHPHRFLSGRSPLPLNTRFGAAEHWPLLLRSIIPIIETGTMISDIAEPSLVDTKPSVMQRNRLPIPGHHLTLHYGFTDASIRVYLQEGNTAKLVHLVEGISVERAVFAAPTLLATVSDSSVATMWRIGIRGYGHRRGDVSLQREATLRGHAKAVTCMTANTSWSILVTGSEDGSAIVWDTNRLRYIRTLQTPRTEPIQFASVHESDGMIALASTKHLYLFTLNGHPIAATGIDDTPTFAFDQPPDQEYTGGIGFLNREFLRDGVVFAIGVGTEVALYRCKPGVREEGQDDSQVKPWKLEEQGRLHKSDEHDYGNCSMVRFIGETLYAAFKPGEGGTKHALFQWSLPDGNARHVPESVTSSCMQEGCGRHFGLLEPRRHCGGCGGVFCGSHAVHVELLQQRYCLSCRERLSIAPTLGVLVGRRDSSMPRLDFGNSPMGSNVGSRRGSISGTAASRRNSVTSPVPGQQPHTASTSGTHKPGGGSSLLVPTFLG